MFYSSQFSAAWWLPNAHLQTITAKFLRRKFKLKTDSEILELPDGDFTELAWSEKPQSDNQPIVVLLHGLEGSKSSHYVKGMLMAIQKNEWCGVLMHFRGCGEQPNRQPSSYHSGDTRDITYFSQWLKQQHPNNPLFIIGFSLGGNVLVKYLAEQTKPIYKAAGVICAPLHLASCSNRINQGFSKVYQKYLVDMLKNSTKDKMKLNSSIAIDDEQLSKIKTIKDFDELVTAPINGFSDADDYYQQASGKTNINQINTPCLLIHAKDDPFLSHENIINTEINNDKITFEVSAEGGHVGFITGKNPLKPEFWLEKRLPEFLADHL